MRERQTEELVEIILEEILHYENSQGKSWSSMSVPEDKEQDANKDEVVPFISREAVIEKNSFSSGGLVATSGEANPMGKKSASRQELDMETLRATTSARIGIGRAGPRMKTDALLRFRADHASARDAVHRDVNPQILEQEGLFSVKTECENLTEYLKRPDKGRLLDQPSIDIIKEKCDMSPDVQLFVADGLSSSAIEANAGSILPSISDALKSKGVKVGTPFFVQYGRVGVEDHVSLILDAKVVCVLIGERPGLMTAESMSAYIAYRATPNMPESRRTVVSNIHRAGTPAAEAGAFIADLIEEILKAEKSGVDLKR